SCFCLSTNCCHSSHASVHASCSFSTLRPPPSSTPFPYTTLFRSRLSVSKKKLKSASSTLATNATAPARNPVRALSIVLLAGDARSEEHTSELQSRGHLVCRLLLEKKKNKRKWCSKPSVRI